MDYLVYILAGFASALLGILEIAMLLRAILSWFPGAMESPVYSFACMVTEPIVAPIRALFDRMGWLANSPIDFSFLIAFVLLTAIQTALSLFAPSVF